jgi:5-methylcytosine-specific restriction enzyme B
VDKALTFTIGGDQFTTSQSEVLSRTRDVVPDQLRDHGVKLHGKVFPVKQVVSLVTGLDRLDFQSMQARSILKRLGFEIWRAA